MMLPNLLRFHASWWLLAYLLASSGPARSQPTAEELFTHPPQSAKPRAYWIWAHGNFDYGRIKEELALFHGMGIGGLDIFDMGIRDPHDIIPPGNPFMGERMLDGIAFALKEANKLGMDMGLSVSNGWNAGGDWTTSDEKIMRLLFWKDTLQGPVKLSRVGFPEVPTEFAKPYGRGYPLFPEFDEEGFPVYYENVGLLAYPLTRGGKLRSREDIIYFDPADIQGNEVAISLPKGRWVLARAVVTPLGQKMWVRSDRSNGFIMDHYSQKATQHHFEHILGKLSSRIPNLGQSSLERLYLASFEAEDYIIWSPELREAFEQQHGYRLDPYLPIFAGQQLESESVTQRFLHDYRSTVSEMFVNNHYRQARAICHRYGVKLASEAGGPGPPLHYVPTEDLKALGSVDIMRGEFWNMPQRWEDERGNNLLQVVKNIASAAHIYGHKVVEMEAFTSQRKHWEEVPLQIKKTADRAFCEGMNRVVYHTSTHSPKEAGVPGWSYNAGTHITPRMAWWDLSRPLHAYLTRVSALLQAGTFVADVAYYYGEDIPNFASGPKYLPPSLGEGYDYDDLNKEVLLQSSVTPDGRLRLPSGMTYALLVLPAEEAMSLEVLEKIDELLRAGATVLGPPPTRVPGLQNYREQEQGLRQLVRKLWGNATARKKQRSIGLGTLITGYGEREILLQKGIQPDLKYTASPQISLDFIHRRNGQEDIYFVRNEDSTYAEVMLDLRSSGNMPQLFDPETGHIMPLSVYAQADGRTQVPLSLEPFGSALVVLGEATPAHSPVTTFTLNGKERPLSEASSYLQQLRRPNGTLAWVTEQAGDFELTYANGQTQSFVSERPREMVLDQAWDVRFPHGWGFEPIQPFERLMDWRDHPDAQLSIFSGLATYHTAFELSEAFLAGNKAYALDLGEVGEVARVYLNGREIGSQVFPPFRFDLQDALRPGTNYLSVEVANTWLNQLIGQLDIPRDQQRLRSNLGEADSDERPWTNKEPLPAGLMGPVRIIAHDLVPISFP